MSADYFKFDHYSADVIASRLDNAVRDDGKYDVVGFAYNYRPDTLERLRETAHTLRRVSAMLKRVNSLVADYSDEDTFHRLWPNTVEPPFQQKP